MDVSKDARRRAGTHSVVEMELVVPVGGALPLFVLVVLENGVEQRVHNLAELLDLGPEALHLPGKLGFGASQRVPTTSNSKTNVDIPLHQCARCDSRDWPLALVLW